MENGPRLSSNPKSFQITVGQNVLLEAISSLLTRETIGTYIPKPKFLAEATEDTEQNEAQGLRWDLVRAWLKQCTSEHKICCRMNEESDFLPTRLLDLGSGPSLQLRLRDSYTLPSKTKYTTLSHCWGKLEITKLLQSNIEDMRHTIPSSQLCKTFLDAIEVTKQLGAQYLWIDSLCIMQDSTHDWVQESEMMYDIYKHSMCNIAATSAVDGSCGMLSPLRSKQPLSGQAVRILVPLKSRDTVIIGYSESIWMREIDDAPLRSRAWVVQELVLSPRVLHFGARQMFWDCAQLRASETFQTGTYSGFINNNKVAPGCLLDSVTLESSSAMQRRSKLTWQLVQRWMQLVEEYTACSLTVASDRLLAISGLAKSMPFIHDRYFAGMWHLFFELQMLWKVAQSRKPKMPAILKGSNYQPPSWSWASMDVEVEFEYKRSPYPRTNRVASVIKIDVSLASNDPTGAVVGGVARLKCPMIKAFQETCSYSLLWDHSKPELFRGDFIYLLLISSTTGLIIAPTKTKAGEFKRKGYFSPDFSTIVQNNINITKAADEMASRCMESINILSEREYESAEPDADFGHVFTITII